MKTQNISKARILSFGKGGGPHYVNFERMGTPIGVQKAYEHFQKSLHPLAFSSQTKTSTKQEGAYYGHELGRARRLMDARMATPKDLEQADKMFERAKLMLEIEWGLSLKCGADFIRGFSRALDYEARQPVENLNLVSFVVALAQWCDADAQPLIKCLKANHERVGYNVAEFVLSKLPQRVSRQAQTDYRNNPKGFVRRLRKQLERLGFVPGRTRKAAIESSHALVRQHSRVGGRS